MVKTDRPLSMGAGLGQLFRVLSPLAEGGTRHVEALYLNRKRHATWSPCSAEGRGWPKLLEVLLPLEARHDTVVFVVPRNTTFAEVLDALPDLLVELTFLVGYVLLDDI